MFIRLGPILVTALATFFLGCGEEQRVYTIPKEKQIEMPMSNNMASMNDAVSSAESDTPEWRIPDGWVTGSTNNIRRGAFTVEDESGKLEITVTVFPGDVGGDLANVNRWAGQIELPPFTIDSLKEILSPINSETFKGQYVTLSNDSTAKTILAAIIPKDGNTWFVKASGPSTLAKQQQNLFKQFVESFRF